MCNNTGIDFVKRVLLPEEVIGKAVIESGAHDINGSVRPYVEQLFPNKYIGTDIVSGKGVDKICDANNLIATFGEDSFDVLISTEALEHIWDWRNTISNYKRVVKPGGILVITTRSKGFPFHGYPDDCWRYEAEDMEVIFSDFEILALEKDTESPGIFIKARKPAKFVEKDLKSYKLYSINIEKKDKKMLGNAPRSYITGVPGWETDQEQETLARLAKGVKQGGLILEIGGEYGMSASIFCHSAWPDVKIITVDVFPDNYQGFDSLLEVHRSNLKEAGFFERSTQIKGDSKEIGKNKLKNRAWRQGIDLLFIDGDHSYEGCLADVVLWSKNVNPGGLMVFHDYVTPDNKIPHPLHHLVTKAVKEWFATEQDNWEVVGYSGTLQIFRKKAEPVEVAEPVRYSTQGGKTWTTTAKSE